MKSPVKKNKEGLIATLEGKGDMRTDLFECMARHGERVEVVRSDDEAYEETRRLFDVETNGGCEPLIQYLDSISSPLDRSPTTINSQ